MWHTWNKRGKCTRFWYKTLKERDQSEDCAIDRRRGSKETSGRLAGRAMSGLNWLRIVISCKLL
jgi:hypothetical protein